MEIRPEIAALPTLAAPAHGQSSSEEDTITVSSATKRIAFAYERFRNTLEPEEEDILRRRAIVRILERRLVEDRPSRVTAEQLLQELLRASYITVARRSFSHQLAKRLDQIQHIRRQLPRDYMPWFMEIAAVSIDRAIYPHPIEEQLVHHMYEDTRQRVEWIDRLVDEPHRLTQLYIACHRALFTAEDSEIAYHYFVDRFPAWKKETVSASELDQIARALPDFFTQVNSVLNHPSRERLMRLLRPVAVPYRIIRDLAYEKPEALTSPEALTAATAAAITHRLERVRSRMNRRAWHSVLFLFLTKIILALIIEIPYELFFLHGVHVGALLANSAFPPLLLLTAVSTARLPGQENTERLGEEVYKIAVGEAPLPTLILQPPRRYGALTWTFFAVLYAVMFATIFWLLFSVLDWLNFSLVAMFMFIIFVGLVSFFAIRVRRSVNEIRVINAPEGIISTSFGFLSLPIIEFGRWLAQGIRELNIVLFFMDRILEAPFKVLIDVIEEWFMFVRDRQEEIM